MKLVENPPSTAPDFGGKVVLMVAGIDDRIDELADECPWVAGTATVATRTLAM